MRQDTSERSVISWQTASGAFASLISLYVCSTYIQVGRDQRSNAIPTGRKGSAPTDLELNSVFYLNQMRLTGKIAMLIVFYV